MLNAEQIKKELALFIDDMPVELHLRNRKTYKFRFFLKSILALIGADEQKIFELENRLKECENGYDGTLHLDRCKLHDAEEKIKELDVELKAMRGAANSYKMHNKRLTEENDRLEKLCALRDQDNKDTQDLLYKAEAENERLKGRNEHLAECLDMEDKYKDRLQGILLQFTDIVHKWGNKNGYDTSEISLVPVMYEANTIKSQIVVDTVQKMQERLKAVAYQSNDWSHGEHPMVVEVEDIDQIAKEMIGEGK